jgi:predicted Zn-dependent protease
VALASAICLSANAASDAPLPKRSKSDRDINAIGHRQLSGTGPGIGNWYSPQKEREFGEKYSAAFEKSVTILHDPAIDAYINAVAQRITQNSDATLPSTVRVVNIAEPGAFTLPGGHLYLTSGLLLKMQNEGELASVLARGVAHTALHTFSRALTRAVLLQTTMAPATTATSFMAMPCGVGLDNSDLGTAPTLLISFCRGFELDADYFGIQYLYKAGYDPGCFLNVVERLWTPAPGGTLWQAFSVFPPLPDRLRQLRKEIQEILPGRDTDLVSRSEFQDFQERLRGFAPAAPSQPHTVPTLIRQGEPASQ